MTYTVLVDKKLKEDLTLNEVRNVILKELDPKQTNIAMNQLIKNNAVTVCVDNDNRIYVESELLK